MFNDKALFFIDHDPAISTANSHSDNPKSKTKSLNWLGLSGRENVSVSWRRRRSEMLFGWEADG